MGRSGASSPLRNRIAHDSTISVSNAAASGVSRGGVGMGLSDIPGIVGILLTVITIIVAVYYGWRQTRRKSVEWRMTAYGSWLKIEDGIRDKLQVTYDGHLVENLQFVV